jgi:PTH2 family peptidyl-tRNA hydrolase
MPTKQIIVVRKDLNMRKGKIASQVAHASMMFLTKSLAKYRKENKNIEELYSDVQWQWIDGSFAKIVVYVNSENELLEISKKAKEANLDVHHCVDSGATEFHGIPTLTCIAIGPANEEDFKGITTELPLL